MLSLRLSKAVDRLPVDVAALASAAGMTRPVSLRALLRATGSRTARPRIAVLRYQWATPRPGVSVGPVWPDAFLEDVLVAANGWSLHDYWYRCSEGLVDLDLQILPWRTLEQDQSSDDAQDRGKVLTMCRDQAAQDGVDLAGFDHVIAFLHPTDNPAGASGGDAIFDQAPYSLEFYQHETGHVLGYSHAFGTSGDYAYQDDWCVMGFSGPQDHPVAVPPDDASTTVADPGSFWRAGRRLSGAALYRYTASTDFASTSSVRLPDLTAGPQTLDLVAAGESWLHDPSLAVVVGDDFRLTVEYRTPSGDDVGIRSGEAVREAVVVHSIGRRAPLRWQSEDDPVWLEAVIVAKHDQDAWVTHAWEKDPKDVHVRVVSAAGRRVTVEISRDTQT